MFLNYQCKRFAVSLLTVYPKTAVIGTLRRFLGWHVSLTSELRDFMKCCPGLVRTERCPCFIQLTCYSLSISNEALLIQRLNKINKPFF